jgi:CLIP-associating protein 1/2
MNHALGLNHSSFGLVQIQVLQLFDDSNKMVREAAMFCLEEMYRQGGQQFRDELDHQQLRAGQVISN